MNKKTYQMQQNSNLKKNIDVLKSELDTLAEGIRFTLGPFWQNMNEGKY